MSAYGDTPADQLLNSSCLLHPTFQLDHLGPTRFHQFPGIVVRLRPGFITSIRHIDNDQRALTGPADYSGVVNHVFHGNGQGISFTMQDHAQRITHQGDFNAGCIQYSGKTCVIRGQADNFLTRLFQPVQMGDCNFFSHSS